MLHNQANAKASTPTLHQIDSSNESISKREAFVPPTEIGFPTRSESSVNIQSRGSNGSKKSSASVKHISTEPKYPVESGKITKLPAAIGFPPSTSGSNLAGIHRSGSKENNTGEDYKKSSLSSLNNNVQQSNAADELDPNSLRRSAVKSPPISSNSAIEYATGNSSKRNDNLPSLPQKSQNESAWPSTNPTRQSKEFSGPRRFESIVDDGRNHRVPSNASESHPVRNERSGSVASSARSQNRPSKAEAAEEMLQRLRAGASMKAGIQQNSQQTMVEKSASMSSDVGFRKASVGTSTNSSFNPSGLKTLAESPSPYILATSRPQFKGPGIDRLAGSPKNSDVSLTDGTSKIQVAGTSPDQPRLTVTTGNSAPKSPFATGSSPTGTHVRSSSPFAPKPDSRSGSVSSGSKARSLSRDTASLGRDLSGETTLNFRPSFTRNIVSGSTTTDATFASRSFPAQGNLLNPGSRRLTDDNRPAFGFRPNPALTILERSSSEASSITGTAQENSREENNPYAVPGDIHVVQCFPNGDGLFKLIPNWDLESKPALLILAFSDPRYNVFRRALFEIVPSQRDFPLLLPVDLHSALYDE